jgi:hypothetical protein
MADKTTLMAIRLTDRERAAIEKAAARATLAPSVWVRLVAIAASGNKALLEQLQAGAGTGRQKQKKRPRAE